ncbi:MAG: lipocalin family protein [Tannerellaceae bacterium]|nr:lipocalin family protein [Tannerellaceae bacterium]
MKCKKHTKVPLIIGGSLLALGTVAILASCKTIPKGVTAVEAFNKDKYLGHWYEIARMDFHFEKNVINATADYSLNKDGSIKVVNRGYNTQKKEMVESEGKAKFVDEPTTGKLKVSFFGPFYSGYNVIAIDPNYQYALVAGKNRNYLWILSRTPNIPDEIKQEYLNKARSIGYDTSKLMWTQHLAE